jgi:hypothetical protein
VEEALDRSVHLGWRDDYGALTVRYQVERRRRAAGGWGPWAPLGVEKAVGHLDDRGSEGRGLPPGDYQYRIRGLYGVQSQPSPESWSDWSNPESVTLSEPCAGAAVFSPTLPVVTIDDRDADGRYTGNDVKLALEDCSGRGGCVLQALPETYDDVAILLSNGDAPACTPERTACLDLPFPKGLVIQGHGSATVLRSPLWKTPYRPVPLLQLWKRPDLRIQLRNLVLDGRKSEQGNPRAETNNHSSWWHYGFDSWNQWGDHTQRNRAGCIHNVTVRSFMSRGISLADVSGWVVEHSTIEDIGCHEGATSCEALTIPELHPGSGYRSSGYGILVGWHADDVRIRANRLRRITKYSIGLKHGSDGAVTSIRRPRILDNDIREAGSVGIFLAGVEGGLLQNNLIDSTRLVDAVPEHAAYYNTLGVSCMASVERVELRDNAILNSAGSSVNWQCSGDANRVVENRIEGSCREKNPRVCAPGRPKHCYNYADFNILKGAGGSLELRDNDVLATRCASPLFAQVGGLDLVIWGGRYAGGPNLRSGVVLRAVDVTIHGGARFEGVGLEFLGGASGVVAPSVEVLGQKKRFRADPSSRVLVCAEAPTVCRERCAGPEPPAWCSE